MQKENQEQLEIKTLLGTVEDNFENDFEKQNLKFNWPQGLVCFKQKQNSNLKHHCKKTFF